ncbi:hypothetical protein SDRG_12045 [Saprolegnia diclina VS20]|uniref:RING-type domain-containing protein n=1 Tax=Saprolegnia diclina (strain VS20) TaxID=1156394 RepID=T0RD68_SAPDV|nr:hypothetical protein SDRG_12045 [Saprolegnia diclina VS20]EQC30193.1 hypothetical protein SDRG_12045 [Saprolegnia diclina VS20]|eukprot:XP_008616325.1 hypothetical protein SDRG_12045 [Saprolegnia diclina VS20]
MTTIAAPSPSIAFAPLLAAPPASPDARVRTSIGTKAAGYAGKYVQYHVMLVCPVTRRRWSVTKRYSAMLAFRTALQKLYASYARGDDPLLLQLASLLETPFPPKRLDPEAGWVIDERCIAFRTFCDRVLDTKAHLFQLASASALPPVWATYIALAQAFLEVPPSMLSMAFQSRTSLPNETECSICLVPFSRDDFGIPGVVVETQCTHVFHQGCIAEWMETAATCPICRHRIESIVGLFLSAAVSV